MEPMRTTLACIPILCLLAGLAPAEGPSPAARRAWKQLFARPDDEPDAAKIQAVLEAIDRDPARLGQLIESDTTYPRLQAGWQKRTCQVRGEQKAWDVEYWLRIPAGYDPSRSWPLLIAAHGMGGTGRQIGRIYQALLGDQADRWVLLAPTMPGPKGYNARIYQEQAYLEAMMWTRRNVNIDDDRIFLSGYSQGGHGSWHLAVMYPRYFAGAIPMAGVPVFRTGLPAATLYLENTLHLAIWQRWGENDRASDKPGLYGNVDFARAADKRMKILGHKKYRGTEVAGAGHGQVWPRQSKAFVEFLASHRRGPLPETYQRRFSMPYHGRGYYVEATGLAHKPIDLSRPTRIRMGPGDGQPSPDDVLRAQRTRIHRKMFQFFVHLDRQANRLTIRHKGIDRMRIYVYDGLLDLSRPAIVGFGLRAWRGRIPVSAECMLRQYARDRDAGRLLVNVIDLDRRGRAEIRHPQARPN